MSESASGSPDGSNNEFPEIVEILNIPKTSVQEGTQAKVIPDLSKCRAPVYQLFTWNQCSALWKCNLCSSSFPHHKHSGSSVLNIHAKNKHKQEFEKLKHGNHQPPITPHTVKQKAPPQPVTKEGIWSKVMNFVIETNQAYSVVETPSFTELIDYVSRENPNATLLKKDAARDSLTKMYNAEKELLKNELRDNPGKISLIVDCWTSSNQIAFQGVLATWIDTNWNMQVALLDLTILDGTHTGQNLATELANVIAEFGLWGKIMSITTDNASNMDTMLTKLEGLAIENGSEFSSDNFRVRCMAHVVNLACRAIVRSIEKTSAEFNKFSPLSEFDDYGTGIISKLRSAISCIRGSPQRRKKFENICERLKCKHLVLMLDVKTHWNSTFDMLVRAREMKDAFNKACDTVPELSRFDFREEDWKFIDSLIQLLKPFKETTYLISKEKPTLCDTTRAYQLLFQHLKKYTDGENENLPGPSNAKRSRNAGPKASTDWVAAAAKEGWKKLKEYYPSSTGLVYIIATVMDPQLKLDWYKATGLDVAWQRQAKLLLVEHWQNCYKVPESDGFDDNIMPSNSVNQTEVSKRGNMFETMLDETMKQYQRNQDELEQYLSEPVVAPKSLSTGGILGWWKKNSDRYPQLSKLAMDVSGVHGTGVSVERFFSSGPDVLTSQRQRLSAQTVKEDLTLKQWLKRKRRQEMNDQLEDIRLSKSLWDEIDLNEML